MTLAQFYIGCDISKSHLDLFDASTGQTWRITNTLAEAQSLAASYAGQPVQVILEATGRYDYVLRQALDDQQVSYSRIHPLRARRFAEAFGRLAKTDRIDACMLAEFGKRFTPPADLPIDPIRDQLSDLQLRYDQLVSARAKDRAQTGTGAEDFEASITRHIAFLDGEIAELERKMQALISQAGDALQAVICQLKTMPGIGPVAANVLTAHLPELGQRSPGQIAALVGLAPYNRDSGKYRGKRAIRGGRARVRRALYMAALSASRHKPKLQSILSACVQKLRRQKSRPHRPRQKNAHTPKRHGQRPKRLQINTVAGSAQLRCWAGRTCQGPPHHRWCPLSFVAQCFDFAQHER